MARKLWVTALHYSYFLHFFWMKSVMQNSPPHCPSRKKQLKKDPSFTQLNRWFLNLAASCQDGHRTKQFGSISLSEGTSLGGEGGKTSFRQRFYSPILCWLVLPHWVVLQTPEITKNAPNAAKSATVMLSVLLCVLMVCWFEKEPWKIKVYKTY